jgi:hypothetical protein
MQVSEQNKQEAEKVVEGIKKIFHTLGEDFPVFYELAIQDRQSVLEAMQQLLEHLQMSSKFAIQLRITNLTEQIEYLKTKL